MTLGIIMLCHNELDRAAQVARHWARHGCPVVVHVDRRVSQVGVAGLAGALRDLPDIRFCARHACRWGTWGLVQATQTAAELMLKDFPQVQHVFLASGSCLPLRPVADLVSYVESRPQTDFIESVTTHDVGWTVGGLDIERFTLHFPFPWRTRRRLFDFYVRLQRRLGVRRRIPDGVVPHLGSQWWCLTRRTLSAILNDPRRRAHDAYFARVWIPDESYFQTLVRQHSDRIESRSLTFSKFDFQGRPHMFYDDHLQLLHRSDCFVARKIWPRADKLYAAFLTDLRSTRKTAEPNPGKLDRLFSKAAERRTKGRAGLYMQSRFPADGWNHVETAAPYSVFQGFPDVLEDFAVWLARITGGPVHGHLFAPERVEFAGGERFCNGALSDSAALRDYNPAAFLTSLIWNTRGARQCFQFAPRDQQEIVRFIASDPNAQISVVSGAWAVPLFRAALDAAAARQEAARLQKIEAAFLGILQSPQTKARVHIRSLAEFIEEPMEMLRTIVEEISPRGQASLTGAPRLVEMEGFGQFLQTLRNQGMQPVLMGDFPAGDAPAPEAGRRGRPFMVR